MQRLCGEWTPSPTPFFEQALEILSACAHECFTIHAPESSQTKPSHAMPVFALGKYRLHPHLTLAQSFLVSQRLLIGPNPLEIFLSHLTIDATPLVTGRTLRFDWAAIADGSRSAIELTPVGSDSPHPLQQLALRTAILIRLRVIAEVGGRPDL